MEQVLYSRYEDGARPIRVLPEGWEVLNLDGTTAGKYTTAKGLLTALTGHPEGRHWSLDRYFNQGAHAPKVQTVGGHVRANMLVGGHGSTLFDFFEGLDRPTPFIVTTPGISIPREVSKAKKPVSKKSTSVSDLDAKISEKSTAVSGLGVDLSKRAHEVRKLLFAGFGRRMYLSGYDPEDVLQEVYRGLLVRNAGKCPWDPAKSSFGHYVHMVCSCILSNYHRKQHRVQEVEQLGMPSYLDEDSGWTDVASSTSVSADVTQEADTSLLYEELDALTDHLRDMPGTHLALRVLPLLLQGIPRSAIPDMLGVSKAAIHKAINSLRQHSKVWAEYHAK